MEAIWITLLITIGSTVLMLFLYLSGGAKLPTPDLDRWLEGEEPAIESPPLLAAFRK